MLTDGNPPDFNQSECEARLIPAYDFQWRHNKECHRKSSGAYERILLFTPQLDRELTELLISAPNPERITVFFVVAPKDENVPSENAYAFRCIPVLLQKPVHPNVNPVKMPEPDFETEVLERGGAVI